MNDDAILGDLTVVDLSHGISGAYCTKLLAGLGARVILVEPPGGSPLRAVGPFAGDDPHPEKSGAFLYLATGKESVTLDLDDAGARAPLLAILARADVLVEDFPPGAPARWGIDHDTLAIANPRLITAAITPFGQDGPYRDYLTTEIVAQALGGLMYTVGLPEREPLKIGGNPVLYNAGGAAFSAIMAAIRQRDDTGAGQFIDISIQEATALTQIHASVNAAWQGENPVRRPSDLLPAKDGWASVGLAMGVGAETWPGVCRMMERPDLIDDPRFSNSAARRDNREALNAIVSDWVRSRPKEEVYHQLQALRSIAGYVATTADLYASRQLNERGFFQEIDHPIAGRARYPGPPFRIGDAKWKQGRAPLLGEDEGAGSGERGAGPPHRHRGVPSDYRYAAGSTGPSGPLPAPRSPLPLSGVRILDLTQVAIGPYATFMLAGLGAQVIKVESNRRPDQTRGPVQPAGEQQLKQYPHGEPGERPWNRTAFFNQRNRGKLGITLDFSRPAGKELLKRLVATCDVVAENFRAAVMDRQGLDWETLHAVNPRLIYLKLSSQGNSGPEREYGSLGSTLEQTAGLASLTGYTDGVPLQTNETYPDPAAAIIAVGALIAGLRRVQQTGNGQFIDFSQRELTAGVLGEAMMDYAFNGRVQGPIGNRHPTAAPHGVYPCVGSGQRAVEDPVFTGTGNGGEKEGSGERAPVNTGSSRAGSGKGAASVGGQLTASGAAETETALPTTENWIAIAVESDEQWQALCAAMGSPGWSAVARFATIPGRRQFQDEIDERLAEWTAGFDHRELMHLLQARGVPAGAVLSGRELIDDPQLNARGWWEHVAPTEIGTPYPFVTVPWRMSASPYQTSTPAPCLGEHNDLVYRDLLGLSPQEYAAHQVAGVISTEPVWLRD